jgi:hypothetical protein
MQGGARRPATQAATRASHSLGDHRASGLHRSGAIRAAMGGAGWAKVPRQRTFGPALRWCSGGEMAAWAIDAFLALGGAMDAVPLPDGELAGPEPLTEDEVARYVVAAAVWAPSVHNTQPWRFTVRGQQISLYIDADWLASRLHPDPAQRRRLPAAGAPVRGSHPGGRQRAPPARRRLVRKRRRRHRCQC